MIHTVVHNADNVSDTVETNDHGIYSTSPSMPAPNFCYTLPFNTKEQDNLVKECANKVALTDIKRQFPIIPHFIRRLLR